MRFIKATGFWTGIGAVVAFAFIEGTWHLVIDQVLKPGRLRLRLEALALRSPGLSPLTRVSAPPASPKARRRAATPSQPPF